MQFTKIAHFITHVFDRNLQTFMLLIDIVIPHLMNIDRYNQLLFRTVNDLQLKRFLSTLSYGFLIKRFLFFSIFK